MQDYANLTATLVLETKKPPSIIKCLKKITAFTGESIRINRTIS